MIYQFSVLFLIGTCISITSAWPDCFPPCALVYEPVCGTDGMTYPNKCLLNCYGGEATVAYPGVCRSKLEAPSIESRPPCVCTREAKEVCGTDGHTYNNPCILNCAKEVTEDLHIDYLGHCVTEKQAVEPQQLLPCKCTWNLQPVCASNGVTYGNECLMRCAGADLTVAKDGLCVAEKI